MASEWILKEDGYLNVVDCNSRKIIYHPNLNVILIFDENFLKVLDVNSGALLQSCCVAGIILEPFILHFLQMVIQKKQ